MTNERFFLGINSFPYNATVHIYIQISPHTTSSTPSYISADPYISQLMFARNARVGGTCCSDACQSGFSLISNIMEAKKLPITGKAPMIDPAAHHLSTSK